MRIIMIITIILSIGGDPKIEIIPINQIIKISLEEKFKT